MWQEVIEDIKNNFPRFNLDRNIYNTAALSTDMNRLLSMQSDLMTMQREAENALARLAEYDVNKISLSYAVGDGVDQYDAIVEQELSMALAINTEFDTPLFSDRLYSAVKMPESFVAEITPGGRSINVRNNLNYTAGDISEWADAILAASVRERGENYPEMFGGAITKAEVAAHFWKEKYYGTAREGRKVTRTYKRAFGGHERGYVRDLTAELAAKYWETMRARLSNCFHIAPFWEIVDQGRFAIQREIGGKPDHAYPVNYKTNFVENICTRLKEIYNNTYQVAREQLQSEVNMTREKILKELDYIDNLLLSIEDSIYAMRRTENISDEKKMAAIKLLNDKLIERFGFSLSQMKDVEKASLLQNAFLAGRGDLLNLDQKFTVGSGERVRLKLVYEESQRILGRK